MARPKTTNDFLFLRQIGEGSFGTVYLARDVETSKEYAVKCLSKELMKREKKLKAMSRERRILELLSRDGGHPFVIRLYHSFEDIDRVYFCLTYAKKGELLAILRKVGCLDISSTQFYSAELVLALEYLHNQGVVHRDVKPENILFDQNGHILVSDFGSAKVISGDDVDEEEGEGEEGETAGGGQRSDSEEDEPVGEVCRRRATFVGTPQYVSPEMLAGDEVGGACDIWALGAVIYQLLSGQPPFKAVNEYHLMKRIQELDFAFPDGFPSVPQDLVARMLVREPAARPDIDQVKAHSFFSSIDWSSLASSHPPALHPYLPASSGEPEFYSHLDIEPGLDDKAMSRLMGLEMSHLQVSYDLGSLLDDGGKKGGGGGVAGAEADEKRRDRERIREDRLERQRREHPFHRFVEDQLILKSGLVDKKKGLFARRRMFLMTEGPRLFYVDPEKMELRGEIPWCASMRTEVKNFRTFFVHTPARTYYLYCNERKAVEWCKAIDQLRDRYFKLPSSKSS